MKKRILRTLSIVLVILMMLTVFASCNQQGEQGPAGPQGPAGEKGESGEAGNGVKSITKTSTRGVVDTYTVTYTDGTTTTFTVTNGERGIQGIQGVPGKDGHSPIITIQDGYWYIDGVNTNAEVGEGIKGDTGNGISDIRKTGSVGLVDTYTITYTNGGTSTFTVTNGAQGLQGPRGPQGLQGEDGDTPYIRYGYWWIGNVNTNVKAEGTSTDSSTLNAADMGYIVITDYLQANTGADVSDAIQKIIDDNPNRTIYFPDGEYILAKPIMTPGMPSKSVSLNLSNYAHIKAASNWSSDEAMIRLGAKEVTGEYIDGMNEYISSYFNGSCYYLSGGIIDGSNIAKGIAVEAGVETSIRNVSIKKTQVGIHIKSGSNNKSSDADIDSVNISCNKTPGSIGILIEGKDNTITNVRIGRARIGVRFASTGGGNFLRNVHPLFVGTTEENLGSIGFDDQSDGNWYDFCYSDHFEVGFKMADKTVSTYQSCFCYWYNNEPSTKIAFQSTGRFNSTIWNSKVDFNGSGATRAYIKVATSGGCGRIACPIFNTTVNNADDYNAYMANGDSPLWKS